MLDSRPYEYSFEPAHAGLRLPPIDSFESAHCTRLGLPPTELNSAPSLTIHCPLSTPDRVHTRALVACRYRDMLARPLQHTKHRHNGPLGLG